MLKKILGHRGVNRRLGVTRSEVFEQELLAFKWNRCGPTLEPPGTVVWVLTKSFEAKKAYRKGYSSKYSGDDYYDANTGEKIGPVLAWAYC